MDFSGFPLFPLCMIGGVLLQIFLNKLKIGTLVNKDGKADIFPALKQGIGDNNFGGVTLSLALLF